MRKHAFIFIAATLLLLSTALPGRLFADERSDAAQLEQLISKIEAFLPGGWDVAFEVANERWRPDAPLLVVRSREKLPVEYIALIGPPAAGGDSDPDIVQSVVEMEFKFVPYLNPQEYEVARQQNDVLERRRRQYEETRLGKTQSNYKGGFTPASYHVRTGDASPLVREYAFFWLNTEPLPLPTHYYGTLAVVTHDLPPILYAGTTIKIHNAQKDEQYNEILKGLVKLFVPYENAHR